MLAAVNNLVHGGAQGELAPVVPDSRHRGAGRPDRGAADEAALSPKHP
jgi:hypothetical protein